MYRTFQRDRGFFLFAWSITTNPDYLFVGENHGLIWIENLFIYLVLFLLKIKRQQLKFQCHSYGLLSSESIPSSYGFILVVLFLFV